MAAAMAFQWTLAALETLMTEDQMDQHAAVLRAFSVVELWRLRRVCRAFHRWGTAALAALPRVAAIGGTDADGEPTAGVEVLDLSTLRWSSNVLPALPEPRQYHGACAFRDGRVVVVGGYHHQRAHHMRTALQWVPGALGWAPLPDPLKRRMQFAAAALPDGRAMAISGPFAGAGVEVLSADGSSWSALTPTSTARNFPAAAALPCGKVMVLGGFSRGCLTTAELWDPATGAWSDLPPMAQKRANAGCCVLPSGRVAAVGSIHGPGQELLASGEAFDPEARTWQSLPPMAHARSGHVVAVAGGLLAVGGAAPDGEANMPPDELFDEASGRWFELPHSMAQPRQSVAVVSLPAAACAAPPAAAAAAAAD
eukprot:COSAG04_NODE_4064_length_2328_cov_1.284432_1_plen_368_part_00